MSSGEERYKDTPHYDLADVAGLISADKYRFRPKAEDYVMCEIGAAVQEACNMLTCLDKFNFHHSELSKKINPLGHWMDVYRYTDDVYGELYIKFMVPNGKSVYVVSFWFWDEDSGE